MKVLELFCGTKSISKVFEREGHDVRSLDLEERFNPTYCTDILKFNVKILIQDKWIPDYIHASPPCNTFSMVAGDRYWKNGKPVAHEAYIGMAIVMKALEIIRSIQELNPELKWTMENPMAGLRKKHFMLDLPIRHTVTYCQYGLEYMKPTDFWTNMSSWIPKKRCQNKDSCHKSAPRGSRTGLAGDGIGTSEERAIIPEELCEEIYEAVLGTSPIKQSTIEQYEQREDNV